MKTFLIAFLLISQVQVHFAADDTGNAISITGERQQFIENGWARKADGSLIQSTFVLVRNTSDNDSNFSIVILGDDNSSRMAFLHDDSLPKDEAVSRIHTFRAFEFDTVYAGH